MVEADFVKEKELQRLSLELEERSRMVEASIEKRSQDLQRLSLDLEERVKRFEAGIDEKSQELELREKELQSLSLEFDERVEYFEAEKSKAGDLKKMVEECTHELSSKRYQLTMYQRGIEILENKLGEVMVELRRRCSEAQMVQDRKREIDGRNKGLASILDQIKESGKQFVEVDEQLESRERLLKIRSSELDAKEKELECVRESIKVYKSELEQKEKMVQSLQSYSTAYGQEINTKSRELWEIQKMTTQLTGEICVMNDQLCLTKAYIQELSEEIANKEKRHMEIVEAVQKRLSEMDEMAKVVKVAEAEASGLYASSERFRKEVDDKDKELFLLKDQIKLEEVKRIQLKREMEEEACKKKKDLELILSRIGESSKQLELKSKELGEVQKLIEEERKRLCDMQNQHPSAAEAELDYEDALMHHESAASLGRDGVSRALKASPNPEELVLKLVQEYIREGSSLEEDIMVLFCDGLAKLQLPYEPQLQLKAREVATLWKEMITTEAPQSSLETLAFLLFIVAYGLKNLINQSETVLLVSSVAQYEQAPTLFNSFGLKLEMITEFVKDLIKKRQCIIAVRLICLYKLTKDFSPSHILKDEISNLRQSALGKRPAGSSQAKDNDDAGRLRAILELVADYNLEIDLPGGLVTELFVQRKKPTPLARCSSSNQQAYSPNTLTRF